MAARIRYDPALSKSDLLVLKGLASDIKASRWSVPGASSDASSDSGSSNTDAASSLNSEDEESLHQLKNSNDPSHANFEPTISSTWDLDALDLPPLLDSLVRSYVGFARTCVRFETDVVFITHLLVYLGVIFPSAVVLFWRFSWLHAIPHMLVTGWFLGAYVNLTHVNHHQGGLLARHGTLLPLVDRIFPYIVDPLMGHTWHTYHWHHKLHHIEDNGPADISSTLPYQRDDPIHLLKYVARFIFLVWYDLPMAYCRRGSYKSGARALCGELSSCLFLSLAYKIRPSATWVTMLVPLLILRVGFMVGNWGQHALIDHDDPGSQLRMSTTLIDVNSNRRSFNDGYHSSHHENPRRHWRDHPAAFIKSKASYARAGILVFHNIDFLAITYYTVTKSYAALEKAMVPMGDQINMTVEERIQLLRNATKKFSDDEIKRHFAKKVN